MSEEKKPAPGILGKPGGLYDSVHMTRRQANWMAVGAIALLVLVTVLIVAFGRGGFHVTFDAAGGTDVPGVTVQYGEALPEVGTPTREGYAFTGWYLDPEGSLPWDTEADTVTDNVTLYAGWQKIG